MSSNGFSVFLRADPGLRRLVLVSGALLLVAGVVAIAVTPVSATVRVLIAVPWAVWGVVELILLNGHWRTYAAIRVWPDGRAALLNAGGDWCPATILPGSVLLSRCAWIRVRPEGGKAFAEPLRGARRKCHDWRRLHVLWPHIGAPD